MNCCQTVIEGQFSRAKADEDLRRFQRNGPDHTTRKIIETVQRAGCQGASLLDIGAGIGVIHHELLPTGLGTAVHVEVSDAYLQVAREESQGRGYADRVRFVRGDFVEVADRTGAADIVTLDRVICCYPHMEPLLERSAASCRRLLLLSFPHDRWYVRAVIRIQNLIRLLKGSSFRTFVHPVRRVEEILENAGFERLSASDSPVWRVAGFRRRG